MGRVLTSRELNRATLVRQSLLDRVPMAPLAAIHDLAGLNAQLVPTAYLSLQARLTTFAPADLVDLLRRRQLVRANVMRGTIHLLAVADYFAWRPALHPVLARTYRGFNARTWSDVDPEAVREVVRELLRTERPTRTELTAALGSDAAMFLARVVYPLVQIPPAGEWGNSGQPRYAWAEDWFGRHFGTEADAADIILRYLRAFGPASVKDVQTWSGLTGLTTTIRTMNLERFQDSEGRTLYDVPGGPLPDPRTPAPVRLLPEFDNLLFAHADRTRIVPPEIKKALQPKAGQFRAPVLIDGFAAGMWKWVRRDKQLLVTLVDPVPRKQAAELRVEAQRLAEFFDPDGQAVL